MSKEKTVKEISLEELVEAAKNLIRLDNHIKELRTEKRDYLSRLKSEGYDTKALNKAIKEIQYKKEKPNEVAIIEFYQEKLEGQI